MTSLIGMLIADSICCYVASNYKIDSSELDSSIIVKAYSALCHDDIWRESDDSAVIAMFIKSKSIKDDKWLRYEQDTLTKYCRSYGFNRLWIVKPEASSCGENISIKKGLLETLQEAQKRSFKCIIQRYIEKPLLVRTNKKFDIRQWVLVTSIDPFIIFYGFSECYLRLSSEIFSLDDADLSNRKVHLCNHAVQKQNLNSDEDIECSSQHEEGYFDTMMTIDQFDCELRTKLQTDETASPYRQILLPKVKEVCIKSIISVRDKLQKVGDSYEWLGLDLMITEDLDVYLIEVNVSPDISRSTPITERLVEAATHDLFTLIIDEQAAKIETCLDLSLVPRLSDYTEVDGRAQQNSSCPRWECWYAEKPSTSSLQFSRAKKDRAVLSRKVMCAKDIVFENIIELLQKNMDDSDEDEI